MSTGPGNGSVASGFAGIGVGGIGGPQPSNAVEEMLLRQRLGQEIPHTGNTPKRTESLYLSPARKKETVHSILFILFFKLALRMECNRRI